MNTQRQPSVSVVVPSYNRRDALPAMLAPLLADSAAHEVIVVVDGSTDGTAALLREMAHEHPRLHALEIENRGENGARQAGVEAASGEVVLFVDDDVVAGEDLVRGHARHHAEGDGLVVLGAMPVQTDGPPAVGERLYAAWYEQRCADYERNPADVLQNLWAGNVSMRRADALRVGLESDFDAAYNPDRDFGLRCRDAGLHGRFDRALRASHRYRRPLEAFRRDARTSGEGRWLIHARHARQVGPLAPDVFAEGLPAARRQIVSATRRPRAARFAVAALGAAIPALERARRSRAEEAAATLLLRIEQQQAALARDRAARVGSGPVPVSVVIPAHNRPDMVRRAVASAQAQTRPPAEIIVVDDCSTDDTAAAGEAAGARVLRHDVNQGEGSARNTGIAAATQPWVALLDSDDEWLPNHLETLWSLRADHVLVGASCIGRGDGPDRIYGNPATLRVIESPAALVHPESFLAPSAAMVRRDTALAAGGFEPGLKMCADLDFWLRVLDGATGISTPAPTVLYHLHAGQVSGDRAAMKDAHLAVVQRYRDRPWYSQSAVQRFEGQMAWDELRGSDDEQWTAAKRLIGRIGTRPQRVLGILETLRWRLRVRRASARLSRLGATGAAYRS